MPVSAPPKAPCMVDVKLAGPPVRLRVPQLFCLELYTSHGRRKVPSGQNAAEEVVGVTLDTTDGNVARCFGATNVQPNRDVLELRALQLVDGACVSWPDGIGRHVAAVLDVVRDRVDRQMPVRLGLHVHALGLRLIRLHHAFHPIDEVCLFVDIARDVQPHAFVELHVQSHWWPTCDELVMILLWRAGAGRFFGYT